MSGIAVLRVSERGRRVSGMESDCQRQKLMKCARRYLGRRTSPLWSVLVAGLMFSSVAWSLPPNLPADTPLRVIFVTSDTSDGNLGGLAGADTFVDTAANNPGSLLAGESVIAILSVTGTTAQSRFADGGEPIYNTQGELVANSLTDMFAGAGTNLTNAILYDETGSANDGIVWTGTDADGTLAPTHCSDYTTSSDQQDGRIGQSADADAQWVEWGTLNCVNPARVYGLTDVVTISMTLSKTSTTTLVTSVDQDVLYHYVVRNTGTVTLHGVAVSDDNVDSQPVCNFAGDDELIGGTSVVCTAHHTATQIEIDLEGTLDNSAIATSDEAGPLEANLSIPIGVHTHGFEGPTCPCWSLQNLADLPVEGETAVCELEPTGTPRLNLTQATGCENNFAVTFDTTGGQSGCIVNQFCPGLPELSSQLETNDHEFFTCLDQINTRCLELGIEPPDFPPP